LRAPHGVSIVHGRFGARYVVGAGRLVEVQVDDTDALTEAGFALADENSNK